MLHLQAFTFNPFQENTYVLYNEAKEAWIIDPGMFNTHEQMELDGFITANGLTPIRLLLTHAHIDHILGAAYVSEKYNLLPEVHEADLFFVNRMPESARMYGVPAEACPQPKAFIQEKDVYQLGPHAFVCIHTPGHSPGSISFYCKEEQLLISGDVLFQGSIGRSDLPMGDHTTLINSIVTKLLPLGDDVKVYSGHGPATTIGHERLSNPFLS
jgi:glyoxylase-like metal-dependent hydrolase (beta-lactamase superfamily II)